MKQLLTVMRIIKHVLVITSLALPINLYSQNIIFYSENQVREYLKKNILQLDPLEGFWEGTIGRDSDSPFVREEIIGDASWIMIKDNDGWIYILDDDFKPIKEGTYRFRRIGETDNYKWNFKNSSGIIELKSSYSINFKLVLNSEDSKLVAGNKNFRYNVWLIGKLSKDFPTYSMYYDAFQKRESAIEEEEKVKEWSGTGFA